MNSSTLQINPINDSNRHRLIDDVLYSVPVRIRPTDSRANADILRPARSRKRWAAVRCSATFTQGYRQRGEPRSPKNRCSGLSNQYAQGILTLKALQGIQRAAAGLRMREGEGRNCGCRHIAAAISPPQCERFPCITDDSQQKGRECRQATFLKILKVIEACGPESPS